MQTIAIAGIKGMNILNSCHIYTPNDGQLLLGQGHNIMLSFLLPTGMMREGVKHAALNLYKTAISIDSCGCNQYYEIFPIHHGERLYSERFCGYFIDCKRKKSFFEDENYKTHIDITEIVNLWIEEGNSEGELLIRENCSPGFICYASTNYPIIEMRPSISLICENFYFTQPLSVERVLVKAISVPTPE